MKPSIIIVSIFLILIVASIAIVSFTNIDDLISAGTTDSLSRLVVWTDDVASQVELENPLIKYQIETRCDLFYLYAIPYNPSPHGFTVEKNLVKYYPEELQVIQEKSRIMQEQKMLNRDIPMEFWGLYASIILEEYMINPKLKADVTTIIYNGGGLKDLKDTLANEDPTCLDKFDEILESINLLRKEYKGHRDSIGDYVDSVEVQEHIKSVFPRYDQLHDVDEI